MDFSSDYMEAVKEMNCRYCNVRFEYSVCPKCGYDVS